MRISPLHIWHSIFLIQIWEMTLFVISQYILLWYNFRILVSDNSQWEFHHLTIWEFCMKTIFAFWIWQFPMRISTIDNFGMTIWEFRMKTIFPIWHLTIFIWEFRSYNFGIWEWQDFAFWISQWPFEIFAQRFECRTCMITIFVEKVSVKFYIIYFKMRLYSNHWDFVDVCSEIWM